ncbi:SRPBCC domain-containing protein [Bacillus sp. Xin]|uniref:SRPBCC family protein n=1 Tax=unclassified Bacillus (in: firmicutes) TaxID=185979 RepID=UPI001572DED6|nr:MULTISPECIES: SRPBCC domain-containing protein [unclassified Bacillus (in: firmicutes)]MBC6971421.1 SRPBCC domain-containing protein [Bacillus sp. Xin]NSW35910.1 SRPBCC domain-containing protein [Bacillus sp. Xin1]
MNQQNTLQDITQTVLFEAPIQKVWNVVSTAEGIASWFMPNDFEPKVGHEFHVQSPFGPSPCKVLEIDEPHHLSFSWDTDGWIVSFILKDLGDKTEFTLIHGGWKQSDETISKANEKASVIRDRMAGGWVAIVNEKLKKVVEG